MEKERKQRREGRKKEKKGGSEGERKSRDKLRFFSLND